jgi:hypothetical protein
MRRLHIGATQRKRDNRTSARNYACFWAWQGQNRLVRRTLPRPLLAALVLPLVVILGFQSAWAAYACSMDGKVRDTCCCEPSKSTKQEREREPDVPTIAARRCCDVTIHEPAQTPVVREVESAAFAHLLAIVPAPTFAIAPPRYEHVMAVEMPARPPPRVPIYLAKQALLR